MQHEVFALTHTPKDFTRMKKNYSTDFVLRIWHKIMSIDIKIKYIIYHFQTRYKSKNLENMVHWLHIKQIRYLSHVKKA